MSVYLSFTDMASMEDDERQSVEPGLWRDVEGFQEVVTTLPGDKVYYYVSWYIPHRHITYDI